VRLRVSLPEGARVVTPFARSSHANDGRAVVVNDRLEKGALVFDRLIEIPAGRVQPDAYSEFQAFVRAADASLLREVVVELAPGSRSP
jgi:hypothetical protein